MTTPTTTKAALTELQSKLKGSNTPCVVASPNFLKLYREFITQLSNSEPNHD
jgi:hypothetical protein